MFFQPLASGWRIEEFDLIYKSSVDTSGPMGSLISDDEHTSLSNIRPLSDTVYRENLRAFVARWNRSQEYYALGYFQPSDLPSSLDHYLST
jgi:hypothetical protein